MCETIRRKSWREVCQVASTANHVSFCLTYRYLDLSCSYMLECSSPLRCPHLPSLLTDFCSQFTIDFREGIPPLTVATWKSLRQVPHAQSRRRPCYPRANSKVTTGLKPAWLKRCGRWMLDASGPAANSQTILFPFFFFIVSFLTRFGKIIAVHVRTNFNRVTQSCWIFKFFVNIFIRKSLRYGRSCGRRMRGIRERFIQSFPE